MHKFGFAYPVDHEAQHTKKAQPEQKVEALRLELDTVQFEVNELKTIHRWVCKAVPETLPTHTECEEIPLHERMEIVRNENDLTDLLVRTMNQVTIPLSLEVPLEAYPYDIGSKRDR